MADDSNWDDDIDGSTVSLRPLSIDQFLIDDDSKTQIQNLALAIAQQFDALNSSDQLPKFKKNLDRNLSEIVKIFEVLEIPQLYNSLLSLIERLDTDLKELSLKKEWDAEFNSNDLVYLQRLKGSLLYFFGLPISFLFVE